MARWIFAAIDTACGYCNARTSAGLPVLEFGKPVKLRCQVCGEKYLPLDPQTLQDAQDAADERAAIQAEGQPHFSLPKRSAPVQPSFTTLSEIAKNFDPKKKAHDEE